MVMRLRIGMPDIEEKGGKCIAFPPTRDYDAFFGVGDPESEALKVCNGTDDGVVCPARHECLLFSIVNNEAYGIWGGMYADDRATLRRFTPKEEWGWRPPSPRDV
jgi:hypothetical protein